MRRAMIRPVVSDGLGAGVIRVPGAGGTVEEVG